MKKIITLLFVLFTCIVLKGQSLQVTVNGALVGTANTKVMTNKDKDSTLTISASGELKGATINGWQSKLSLNSTLTLKNMLSTYPTPQTGTMLHIISDTTVNGRISFDTYNSSGIQGSILQGRRGRGRANTPTSALTDDILLVLGGDGYGTTGFHNISLGSVAIRASENITDVAGGTYIALSTSPNGTIANTERMRILNDGKVGIGTTTPITELFINGSVGQKVLRLTSSSTAYVILPTDNTIHIVGTLGQTLILPTAASSTGRVITISNDASLASTTSIAYRTSSVGTTSNIAAAARIKIQSDGTEWFSTN